MDLADELLASSAVLEGIPELLSITEAEREALIDDYLLEHHLSLIPNPAYSVSRMPEPQNVVCNVRTPRSIT